MCDEEAAGRAIHEEKIAAAVTVAAHTIPDVVESRTGVHATVPELATAVVVPKG